MSRRDKGKKKAAEATTVESENFENTEDYYIGEQDEYDVFVDVKFPGEQQDKAESQGVTQSSLMQRMNIWGIN